MGDFYPPENYYRVSIKALIFDEIGQLLVFQFSGGEWGIPGGGWNHDEDYQSCIRRELAEEAGAQVESVGALAFFYRSETFRGNPKVNLVFPVRLATLSGLKPGDDDLAGMCFVARTEFEKLTFKRSERVIQSYADQIWAVVEKNSENR